MKTQISLKQIAVWLAIGFIVYLVWVDQTGTVTDRMSTYLRAIFGFLGEFIDRLGSFLSGLFGPNERQA